MNFFEFGEEQRSPEHQQQHNRFEPKFRFETGVVVVGCKISLTQTHTHTTHMHSSLIVFSKGDGTTYISTCT